MRLFVASTMVLFLSASVGASSPPPLPPDGWDYSFNTAGEVIFTWNTPSFPTVVNIAHYNLYIIEDGEAWQPIEIDEGATSHNLGTVVDGATYVAYLTVVSGEDVEGAPTPPAIFKGGTSYPRCMFFAYAILPPAGPDANVSPECILPPP